MPQGQTDDRANLELTVDQMRQMSELVVTRILDHFASLPVQPAGGKTGAEAICRSLRADAPETGTPLAPILDRLFDDWIPYSFTTPSAGYLAFISGGGLFPAALADFVAGTTNRFTGIWQAAPVLVQLEANVLDWFRDWMGFPATTRGLLTTGGSSATFNAIVCARERLLGSDIRSGVLYTSSQAHHAVVKSARLAGIAGDRVRVISVDAAFRMQVQALADRIRQDRENGLKPFLVVSAAGTVNTGAVDPLDAIADLCEEAGLWHHVDGAYGAFFHMCDELRPLLAGLSRADSLTLDPHKSLFLPYGTGALLVRDGAALRQVHGGTASYLPTAPDADTFYDPSQHGPDLSRGFPGLRVWMCLQLFGAARFRHALVEKRDLAVAAAERLASQSGFVMVAPPQLSLFAFHLRWPGASLEEENHATQVLLERVCGRGKVMLTGCRVGGRFLGRVCVLSFRTRREHVDTCVEHLIEESSALLDR